MALLLLIDANPAVSQRCSSYELSLNLTAL